MNNQVKWIVPILLLIVGCGAMLLSVWADMGYHSDPGADAKEALDPAFREWTILEQKAAEEELTPEEEQKRQRLGPRIFDRFVSAFLARYILEGEVVDLDGNRLDGVDFRVSMAKTRGPDKWEEESEEKIINGMFSIEADGYTVVRLYFNKEGYYPEELHFTHDGAATGDDIIGQNRPTRRSLVEHRDIRVVMERMGDITQLVPFDRGLTFKIDAGVPSGEVLPFDREMWEKRRRGSGHLRTTVVRNLLDSELLPPQCVYIIADVNEDGRLASVAYPRPGWHGREDRFPQSLHLIMNDSDGGFILFDPEEDQPAYWQMKRAPEDGYAAEWVFSAEDLHALHGFAARYFYFKINGMYGKGRVDGAELIDGGYGVRLGVTFQLQMDGSRNLDTGRR